MSATGGLDFTRDVCDRCELVIAMPLDGGPSAHLCVHNPVPWDALLASSPHLSQGFAAIRRCRLIQGRATRTCAPDRFRAGIELDAADADRVGPHPPGTTPAAVLICDLLSWTIDDLDDLPGVGDGTISALQTWLVRNGYMLRRRNDTAFRAYLLARLRTFVATSYLDHLERDAVALTTSELVEHLARAEDDLRLGWWRSPNDANSASSTSSASSDQPTMSTQPTSRTTF